MAINLDDLQLEAYQRAVEQAAITFGSNASRADVGFVMLQAQIATLISKMVPEDQLEEFWGNVVTVTRQGRTGAAS